ncbi:tetratricopeptide repeat protein [Chitinophaga arvensicola]|uniref:tetratricopeptide repeat protein n=1 Tax=Chitinophaga arvensicola TaxID=29529 RepID=UPI000B7F48D8|nr:tetratricopeptide repeat protein [Chitinophaga arvensicola]
MLLTAVYSEPGACYFDKKGAAAVNYPLSIYVVKDTVKTVNRCERQAHDFYGRGLFKKAIIQWKKVLHLQPDNAFAMFMLGKSYMGAGEKEKGEYLCDQAIAIGEQSDKNICHSVEGF